MTFTCKVVKFLLSLFLLPRQWIIRLLRSSNTRYIIGLFLKSCDRITSSSRIFFTFSFSNFISFPNLLLQLLLILPLLQLFIIDITWLVNSSNTWTYNRELMCVANNPLIHINICRWVIIWSIVLKSIVCFTT